MSTLTTTDRAEIVPAQQQDDPYAFLDRTEGDAPTLTVKGQEDPKDGHPHGFVYGISYEDYDRVDALNASKIVLMRRSPLHYKYFSVHPKPATPATTEGTLIHRLVLEPDVANDMVVFVPEEGMLKRAGNKWKAFRERNEGKIIMTASEHESVMRTAACALSHAPIASYANSDGPTEVCMFWRHPVSGRRMKARVDKIIPARHTIFDLKSTINCQSYKFGAQSYNLGYHIKIAHYVQGYQTLTGITPQSRLGAIEKTEPHESAVYRVTDDVLHQGWDELEHLLGRIAECEKKNSWPAEHDEETDLLLPAWAQYTELDQYEDVG
jgi:hypothetical protein